MGFIRERKGKKERRGKKERGKEREKCNGQWVRDLQ